MSDGETKVVVGDAAEATTSGPATGTAEKKSVGSVIGGVSVLAAIGGSAAWCIYATIRQDLEPARTLIDLQALWSDGTFGVKTTILLSWLVLLFCAMAPIVMAYSIVHCFQRGEPEPNWLRVGNVETRGKRRLLSLAACAFGALNFYVAFYDPGLFSPIAPIAILVLLLGIVSFFLGPFLLLDSLVPGRWISGKVRTCERPVDSDGKPQKKFVIQLADEAKYYLDESRGSTLAVGQRIALRISRVLDNVIEVRRP
ncbi:MAG TPA: hypothetical protein VLC09_13810 [Polyangiaceae bacterium]|nr:hypothetical protein [Polyangiaceae bacterium]